MTKGLCAWALAVGCLAGCSTPSSPRDVNVSSPGAGLPTAPVILSIAVPQARVEAGRDIAISAVVEDAETPLDGLTYAWTASDGVITGNGPNAIWRMPLGITSGRNVTVTLTVTDTYGADAGTPPVPRQFVVARTSDVFRVHDSEAETRELGRKFLVDLFGNSSIPAELCMVDFTDICANAQEGKINELEQIRAHRQNFIVFRATMLGQRVAWRGSDSGSVHTAMYYEDQEIGAPPKAPTCGDFEVTVVYHDGRWWICESYFNRGDRTHCPATVDNFGLARIMRGRGL